MKKPKVALITNIPSPYRIPLFEKIAKRVDLHVYFMAFTEKDREWGVNLNDKFKYTFLNGYSPGSGFGSINYHINLSIIKELINNDYDVVIVGGYSSFTTQIAFLICKLKKMPIILWSGNTIQDDNLLRKLTMPLVRFLIKKSESFIVYGTRAKEYIMSMGISTEKIFIAINVGDVEFYYTENERLKKQKEKNKKLLKIKTKYNILFVGRLIDIKGVKYLIDAFKKLKLDKKDIGLIIVGDGPIREELEERCRGVNDTHFFKFVQPLELPIYYSISDVFVLPSFYDRFGIVLSEAMASELPVIATIKIGGSRDLIKNDHNGYIVKEKNHYEIYESLINLFDNPIKFKNMGKNSKKLIKNELNLDKTAEGFFDAITYTYSKKHIK